jgi:DNA-binding CsgD family transcriptional regulator
VTALTLRESEVMDLLAEGLSREQIAHRLRISPQTVKWYLRIAREKYDAPSTLAAAVRHERRRWQTSPV